MNLIGPINTPSGVGYIDETGVVRIPFAYEHIGRFHEGLACFVQDRKLGFMNLHGDVVIEPKYSPGNRLSIVSNFSSGLAPVRFHSKEGYIDKSGAYAIPCEFALCEPFIEDIALVFETDRHKRSVINLQGQIVARLEYHHVAEVPYGANLIKVHIMVDGQGELAPAFVDRFGKMVAGPFSGFEDIQRAVTASPFFGTALHRSSQLWGYVDQNWQTAIPFKYGRVTDFHDGMAAASNPKHLWGYIDPCGRWLIAPEYTQAHRFYGTTASVRQGRGRHGKWVIIDRHNAPITSIRYDDVYAEFERGFRYVKLNGKSLVINACGNVVWASS